MRQLCKCSEIKENADFLLYFTHLFVPLRLCLLGRLHLGNKRKFLIFFVFRSVCTTFDAMRRRYLRSKIQKKKQFSFVCLSLIRTIAHEFRPCV